MRELFVAPPQRERFWRVLFNPLKMRATCVEAMAHDSGVFVETIKRQRDFGIWFVPVFLPLVLIGFAVQIRAHCNREIIWRCTVSCAVLGWVDLNIPIGDVLQMAFANEAGVISSGR